MFFYLIKLFFNYGMTPSVWLKSIIIPIPKSATKDAHVPLHDRSISLLSMSVRATLAC